MSSITDIDINQLNDISSLKKAVVALLNHIELLHGQNIELKHLNQQLRDEINHLKGEQGKPDIKPNTKNKNRDISTGGKEKTNRVWGKKPKKPLLPIDKTQISKVDVKSLPSDAVFKGYDELIQQDVIFIRENTLFKLEKYYSPSKKKIYRAPIPDEYTGYHSNGLKSFSLVLKNVCDATSNKILLLLRNRGIEISDGALSNILLSHHQELMAEKNSVLKAGLTVSYAQIDGTGSRVCGRNHHTQIICNDFFTSYTTLPTKSALDILSAFQGLNDKEQLHLLYNEKTVELLELQKISISDREVISKIFTQGQTLKYDKFEKHIKELHPVLYDKPNMYNRVKEAFALSFYHSRKDFPVVKGLMSDNAPEYNKIALSFHALCWVHEVRHYKKLSPLVESHKQILEIFMDRVWGYYHELLSYKENPTEEKAKYLDKQFDTLFQANTEYFQLNQRIEKTIENKSELLAVLKYPEIPLHNNLSELWARYMARKRDISLHTMTDVGTQIQDAWMTIIQTAIKLKIDVYKYIEELISTKKDIYSLSNYIYEKAGYNINSS